jgi:hypothetical protein
MSVFPETAVQRRAVAHPAWPAVREVMLVGALFVAYKLARIAVTGHAARAMVNAWSVWGAERRIGLPSEVGVQHLLLHSRPLVYAANSYYAYVHFTVTAVALVWMYLRRPAHYQWFRRMLAFLTGAALVVHLLFPVAPPRMLGATGIIDTGKAYGPAVYGSPSTDTLTNQYAAMPSLHVGWALAVAVALIVTTRGRWRWAWLLYPLVTLTVVVVTGNHYWLDAAAGIALLGAVLVFLPLPMGVPRAFLLARFAPRDSQENGAQGGAPAGKWEPVLWAAAPELAASLAPQSPVEARAEAGP